MQPSQYLIRFAILYSPGKIGHIGIFCQGYAVILVWRVHRTFSHWRGTITRCYYMPAQNTFNELQLLQHFVEWRSCPGNRTTSHFPKVFSSIEISRNFLITQVVHYDDYFVKRFASEWCQFANPTYVRSIIQLTECPINPLSFVKIDRVREIAWLDPFRSCDCNCSHCVYYVIC